MLGGDPETNAHGPHNDSSFLFINSTGGPDDDYSSAYARLLAPAYQNSNVDCQFRFYYYFNGSAGDAVLEIGIQEDELDVPLDFIHLDDITEPTWNMRVVGLGRIPGHIQVRKTVVYDKSFFKYNAVATIVFSTFFIAIVHVYFYS